MVFLTKHKNQSILMRHLVLPRQHLKPKSNVLFLQVQLMFISETLLTEEELAVFKRGRNAHVHTVPRSASRADYLRATALECLLGYLYLQGRRERINQLFAAMMEEEGYAT